ncbi:YkvA family protein [uncultured Oceanisphaera sp.]|uniref:YkvA family protein n=1 Tax=uncultured Oceanisphaera sp. TaxID=353858 RepID=UPI00262BC47B|nr:YkvA family protein [uncultured Oceanisphaera sp.]
MALSREQEARARARFTDDMDEVGDAELHQAAREGERKLDRLAETPPAALLDWWQELKLMVSLLNDYRKGDYRAVPWKVMAALTGAVIYFVSPLDVVPDFLPLAGYLDDALVIKLALDLARADLARYAAWKAQQPGE